MRKKKIWANFQRIIELFTKEIVKKLLKIWSWDPGSEIRDPEKTYSGSRIQGLKSTQSRIRIRNTGIRGQSRNTHCSIFESVMIFWVNVSIWFVGLVSAWRVLACVSLSEIVPVECLFVMLIPCFQISPFSDKMVHQQRQIVLEHRLSSLIPGEPTGVGPASLNCWLPRLICLWTVVSSGNKTAAISCCRTLILDSQLLAFTQLGKESATDRTFILNVRRWCVYFAMLGSSSGRIHLTYVKICTFLFLCYFKHKNGQIPPLKYLVPVCRYNLEKFFYSWGSLTCNSSFFTWSILKGRSRPCKIFKREKSLIL